MAATSTRQKQSRFAAALDDFHRQAQRMRPPTAPAYYQGRAAWMWMAVFNRTRPHA